MIAVVDLGSATRCCTGPTQIPIRPAPSRQVPRITGISTASGLTQDKPITNSPTNDVNGAQGLVPAKAGFFLSARSGLASTPHHAAKSIGAHQQ